MGECARKNDQVDANMITRHIAVLLCIRFWERKRDASWKCKFQQKHIDTSASIGLQ